VSQQPGRTPGCNTPQPSLSRSERRTHVNARS
jgi:hypothetical protein